MEHITRDRSTVTSRREMLLAAAVILVVTAVFVIDAAAHHALGASRLDDWSYLRVAYQFADHGTFRLNGWAAMMLLGQIVATAPLVVIFGHSIAALQLAVAVAGAAGIWACYMIFRRFLGPMAAGVACGCLLLGPVFAGLSISYMTDVPAFAAEALALLAGLKAIEKRSAPWLAGSALVTVFGFTIREYAIAAFAAVLIAGGYKISRAAPIAATAAVAVGVLFLARHALPNDFTTNLSLHLDTKMYAQAALTLALFISPAVLAVSPLRVARAAWKRSPLFSLLAVTIAVGSFVAARSDPFLGNAFTRKGPYVGTVLGDVPDVIGEMAWRILRFGAFYALLVALLVLVASFGRQDAGPRLSGWFAVSLAVVYAVATTVSSAPFSDRFLIPLVPFTAALTLHAARRHQLSPAPEVIAAAILVPFAVAGFLYVDYGTTIDGAKWDIAERVSVPARQIDGGFEWFGYHQPDSVIPRHSNGIPTQRDGHSGWSQLFTARPICATTYRGHVKGKPLAAKSYRTITGRTIQLEVVRGPDDC